MCQSLFIESVYFKFDSAHPPNSTPLQTPIQLFLIN